MKWLRGIIIGLALASAVFSTALASTTEPGQVYYAGPVYRSGLIAKWQDVCVQTYGESVRACVAMNATFFSYHPGELVEVKWDWAKGGGMKILRIWRVG